MIVVNVRVSRNDGMPREMWVFRRRESGEATIIIARKAVLFLVLLLVGQQAMGQLSAETRIAFASCADHRKPQPLWYEILEQRPERFLFIGDAVYADTENRDKFLRVYAELAAKPGFRALRERVPVLATWDDHDFGADDAGRDYPLKRESQRLFADFYGLPPESPVRARPGVYDVHYIGEDARRVQIILLDTRYFRSPIARKLLPSAECPFRRYLPDPQAEMLGEAQWRWLEQQLREPATVRILVSSSQLIPDNHCWEKWANAPAERDRLLHLIGETRANGLVVLSGDRHMAEISRMEHPNLHYPLYEITSSGLNYAFPTAGEPNRFRTTPANFRQDNFGMVVIDWEPAPRILLQVFGPQGELALQESIPLSLLQDAGTANR